MQPRSGIACSRKHKLTKSKRYKDELSGSFTATLTTFPTLVLYIVLPFPASQTGDNSSHVSFLNQSFNPHLAYLPSYLTHGIPQLLPDLDPQINSHASPAVLENIRHSFPTLSRVPTGQGKLEKVREFEWSGKVRENAKMTGKSGKFWEKFYLFVQLL